MITSASLLYKRPAGTVGCLNLSKVSKVTDRELPIYLVKLDKWVYVQGVNRDPYIQVAQNK